MILKISDKERFVNYFLSPLGKINNSCVLKLTDTGISCLLSAADNTVVLYGLYETDLDIDDPTTLNLPDIARLRKIMDCINSESVNLTIEDNFIQYTSPELRFKYHVLEDGILAAPTISAEKIKQLEYNTALTIPYASLVNLIKGSTFTLDIHKVYIFTKDGSVYAEINDKQAHNVDSICIKLSDKYSGDDISDPLPIGFETIRTLAGSRCDSINVFINTELNVMTFGVNNDNIKVTYIVSGLAK